MLTESFSEIINKITSHLKQKGINLSTGHNDSYSRKAGDGPNIRVELLCFGHESIKNYLPGSPVGNSIYSFNYFIIAEHNSYKEKLHVTELISNYLDKNPFLPFSIEENNFEMSLSPLMVDLEFINNFWIARQVPHAPVLFYQARISAI